MLMSINEHNSKDNTVVWDATNILHKNNIPLFAVNMSIILPGVQTMISAPRFNSAIYNLSMENILDYVSFTLYKKPYKINKLVAKKRTKARWINVIISFE